MGALVPTCRRAHSVTRPQAGAPLPLTLHGARRYGRHLKMPPIPPK